MIGSLEVGIKALQMTRSSVFIKLSPPEITLMILTVGNKFSVLIVMIGAKGQEYYVSKIPAD